MSAARRPLPSWLIERLDRAGYIDASTSTGRRARATFCPSCRQVVMRGLTAFPGARSVDCDPSPISSEGEALALLCGKSTYEVRWLGDHYEIDTRDQWRIRSRPAGLTNGVDVLVGHTCGEPARWPPAGSRLLDRHGHIGPPPDDPPF